MKYLIPARLTAGRAKDVFMTGAQSGTALGMAFGVWLKEERVPTALERKRWPCVSAHLGAGLRLRVAARNVGLEAEPVEAVLDAHRGHSLGKRLIRLMIDDGPGADMRWTLFTGDAHGLYRQFGFAEPDATAMVRPALYRAGADG